MLESDIDDGVLPARALYRYELPELADIVPELHRSCLEGQLNLVETLLETGKSYVTDLDPAQQTALHYATMKTGREDIIQFLLSKGIDTNRRNFAGSTALHNLVKLADLKQCDFLVNYEHKSYPIDLDVPDVYGNTALHMAVLRNDIPIVKCLLDGGAKLNILNVNGETPMSIAKDKNHEKITQMLIRRSSEIQIEKANVLPIKPKK